MWLKWKINNKNDKNEMKIINKEGVSLQKNVYDNSIKPNITNQVLNTKVRYPEARP